MESEKEFHQILSGTFENMSKTSQLQFKARVTQLMAKVYNSFIIFCMFIVVLCHFKIHQPFAN